MRLVWTLALLSFLATLAGCLDIQVGFPSDGEPSPLVVELVSGAWYDEFSASLTYRFTNAIDEPIYLVDTILTSYLTAENGTYVAQSQDEDHPGRFRPGSLGGAGSPALVNDTDVLHPGGMWRSTVRIHYDEEDMDGLFAHRLSTTVRLHYYAQGVFRTGLYLPPCVRDDGKLLSGLDGCGSYTWRDEVVTKDPEYGWEELDLYGIPRPPGAPPRESG